MAALSLTHQMLNGQQKFVRLFISDLHALCKQSWFGDNSVLFDPEVYT